MPTINEKKLAALSPTAFENLTFDLVRADSLQNVHWRTPGADGGRDIEGELSIRDFAGQTKLTRWFIECKRYKNSVDWPTVWPKVAYADNSQADYLLMVTTGKFSTRCLDEIEKWNGLNRRPAIRVWPGQEVAFRLFLKPEIAAKYNLIDGASPSAVQISSLALHVSRMAQSASAHAGSAASGRYVTAATSLAILLYTRSMDLTETGSFRKSHRINKEVFPSYVNPTNLEVSSDFDWIGLLAYLSCLHVVTKANFIAAAAADGGLQLLLDRMPPGDLPDIELMREVAFWGGLSARQEGGIICLTPQIFG